MTDTPDIGHAIGAVIDGLVAAAVAFAIGKPRIGLRGLCDAHENLGILLSKVREQYSQVKRATD